MLRKYLLMTFLLAILCQCKASNFSGSNSGASSSQKDANLIPADAKLEEFAGGSSSAYKSDIVFLLDSSDSMSSAIKRTNTNLKTLISNYLEKTKDYDYQMFIVGDQVPEISGSKVEHVKQYVGSHSALGNFMDFMDNKYKTVNLKPRIDAVKELVVVSDDESNVTKEKFLSWIDLNKSRVFEVHVNGIVYKKWALGCSGFLGLGIETKIGKTYIDLAANPSTSGVIGDICENDWTQIFANLGKQLTDKKSSSKVWIKLQQKPSNKSNIAVELNGKSLKADAEFQYHEENNSILILVPTSSSDKISAHIW